MQPEKPGNYWDPSAQGDQSQAATNPVTSNPLTTTSHDETYIPTENGDEDIVTWQASEHLQHYNGPGWYVAFAAVVVILIGLSLFLRAWTFTFLIVVMAVAAIIYTRRPARIIKYTLSDKGLYVGDTLRAYSEFKSFGVVNDDGIYSIVLVPIKRFSAGLSVFFPAEDGENIVDILGSRLPMEEHKVDALDKLLRILRF